ncbi:MAG: YIP1 family protein [Chloroflexaceae bacterium]|jgi:hypothetical protein|nr:YIP1 family protein [Chloroflexaceae bacterium]
MMIDTFNGALTLRQKLLLELRDSPQVVRRGLLVVLLVGLLVGGVNGIRTAATSVNPDRELAEARAQFDDALDQQAMTATTPEAREAIRLMRENADAGFALVREIALLPTPLPRAVGGALQGLGVFVSTPLSYLGSLLLWVIFTHIAARWLGGQGNIQQMLGLGALSVAPHALDALGFIPVVGSAISLVATIWGLVVLVVATAVAHKLDTGRATLAVCLFPLVGILLALLSFCILLLFVVAAVSGGA